jgi:hypothetical protein
MFPTRSVVPERFRGSVAPSAAGVPALSRAGWLGWRTMPGTRRADKGNRAQARFSGSAGLIARFRNDRPHPVDVGQILIAANSRLRLPGKATIDAEPTWDKAKAFRVQYVPPFDSLRDHIRTNTIGGELIPNMTYADVKALIQRLLVLVEVDSDWYLEHYPDIAQAVAEGRAKSARDHFINNGYFEGRLPRRIKVDEDWYLEHNPSVAEAVRGGEIESGQKHFDAHGYREGRLPFPI